jgi:type II secretory pathway component PulJ
MEVETKDMPLTDILVFNQKALLDNQVIIADQINSLWNKTADSDQFVVKTVKVLAKQRRLTKFNVIVSLTAMTYVAVSAKIMMSQDKRISELSREIMFLRKDLRDVKYSCQCSDHKE